MGHYGYRQDEPEGQRDSLLAWNYGRHQGHLPPVSNLCKICQESTKGDAAVCRNTSSQMGNNLV